MPDDAAPGPQLPFLRGRLASGLPYLAHLLPVTWLFLPLLTGTRVLFLRDMLVAYWPDYVFLERALEQGVWPLWNPHAYAGTPFLKAYPVDVALVGLWGAWGALSLGVVAHLLLAMCGMTRLARGEGASARGAWLAGAVYGLSGVMLSMVTLLQLLQAAAWAPWTVAAFLAWLRGPTWPRAGLLALVASLQVSTLSVEIAAQTALVGLAMGVGRARPAPRQLAQLAAAGALALLIAAPSVLGTLDLVAGTRRSSGFARAEVLAFSANGAVLAEALVPRLFGGPFWYADGGWGHRAYPGGVPYFLTAYVGPAVLGLALFGGSLRLWALAALGVLLALGDNGPLAAPLALLSVLRFPVKYLFVSTFAVALLAARGLDRLAAGPSRARWLAALPGILLLAAGIVLRMAPRPACGAASSLGPGAEMTCLAIWPEAWFVSGALCAAAGLLAFSRFAVFAGPVLVLDLLIANGPINPPLPRTLLALEPGVQALVDSARTRGGGRRVFSYGVALGKGGRWELPARGSRLIALHRLMRQSVAPPTHVLDGLDGAVDVARTGWEPPGSTAPLGDLTPDRFARHYEDLRIAAVGSVLSFEPLAAAPPNAVLVGEARVDAAPRPLLLYALPDALPRAYWVPRCESAASADAAAERVRVPGFDPRQSVLVEGGAACADAAVPGSAGARVTLARIDPHHVRVDADTPPGWVVVVESHHRNWAAASGPDRVPLLRANGRYWAVATPGGARTFEFRFRPRWPRLAAAAAAVGLISVAALLLAGRRGRAVR